jgi:hypothetical protein
MLMLNSTMPDHFQGVVVIDPVGVPIEDMKDLPTIGDTPLARGAIARKDIFTNRRNAQEYLHSKPYFQAWDPRVVDLHARFGFRPVVGHEKEEDPPVTLAMSKWSEALAFSTSFLGSNSSASIKRSRFTGWAHLICATESWIFGPSGPGQLRENFAKYFSTTHRASTEMMKGGHLIAQEQPDQLGEFGMIFTAVGGALLMRACYLCSQSFFRHSNSRSHFSLLRGISRGRKVKAVNLVYTTTRGMSVFFPF